MTHDALRREPDDEISLRDLYLVLRRNLPLIVLVALAAGLAAFLLARLSPQQFEAQSTTLVAPPPVQIEGAQNITFRPNAEVSFQAYRTLAESRPVIEAALAEVPEAALSYAEFGGSVELLIGSQQASQGAPLAVVHRVRHPDPEVAARLANAWANRSLAAVQEALLASLAPISERTQAELERLRAQLSRAEEAYAAFQAQDQSSVLQALLSESARRLAELERERARLELDNAAREARAQLILASEGGGGAVLDADGLATALERLAEERQGEQLEGLSAQAEALSGALNALAPGAEADPATLFPLPEVPDAADADAETLRRLAALLRDQPAGTEASLTWLLSQDELRRDLLAIAANRAELGQLAAQQEGARGRAAELRRQLTQLELERTQLERERSSARTAFDNVVALQPIIDYVTTITPANARVLNEAAVPTRPVAPRPLLAAAIAVVVAGVLMVLFVFLREAVRPTPQV